MGERGLCTPEAGGSIPPTSTIKSTTLLTYSQYLIAITLSEKNRRSGGYCVQAGETASLSMAGKIIITTARAKQTMAPMNRANGIDFTSAT